MTKRERNPHYIWAHNDPRVVKGRHGTNYLYMNPEDAQRLSLSEGQLAFIESKVGSVIAPIVITDDIMHRSVALPHGWGHQSAAGFSVASQTSGVIAILPAADGPESNRAFVGDGAIDRYRRQSVGIGYCIPAPCQDLSIHAKCAFAAA